MAWNLDIGHVSAQPSFEIDKAVDGVRPAIWGWGWGTGSSLAGHQVPRSATQTDSNKLADIFPLPVLACVGQRVRAIVEAFELGVHDFHPIQLKSRKGVPCDEPYFMINVRQRFDSILLKGLGREWGTRVAAASKECPISAFVSAILQPNPSTVRRLPADICGEPNKNSS